MSHCYPFGFKSAAEFLDVTHARNTEACEKHLAGWDLHIYTWVQYINDRKIIIFGLASHGPGMYKDPCPTVVTDPVWVGIIREYVRKNVPKLKKGSACEV